MSEVRQGTRKVVINIIIESLMIGYCLGGAMIFFLFNELALGILCLVLALFFSTRLRERIGKLYECIRREKDDTWGDMD